MPSMTMRLRTKMLAFPAILVLASALIALIALSAVRSSGRLLEDFSQDRPASERADLDPVR